MGTFYTGIGVPDQLLRRAVLRRLRAGLDQDASSSRTTTSSTSGADPTFAEGIAGPVQIETGPDGALWYVAIGSGELHRIRYVENYTPIQCPDGQFRAEYFNNQT